MFCGVGDDAKHPTGTTAALRVCSWGDNLWGYDCT